MALIQHMIIKKLWYVKPFVSLRKCSSCLVEVTFQAGETDTNYCDQLWLPRACIITLIHALDKQKNKMQKERGQL